MEKILFNLALIETTKKCKELKIDCSGSHLIKYHKRWTYALCNNETGKAIITITFYKNSVPTYFIHN